VWERHMPIRGVESDKEPYDPLLSPKNGRSVDGEEQA
jgi:hypothetical protein